MYFYKVGNQDSEIILAHIKRFSESEFTEICKKAGTSGKSIKYYATTKIVKYLMESEGFMPLDVTACFITD